MIVLEFLSWKLVVQPVQCLTSNHECSGYKDRIRMRRHNKSKNNSHALNGPDSEEFIETNPSCSTGSRRMCTLPSHLRPTHPASSK